MKTEFDHYVNEKTLKSEDFEDDLDFQKKGSTST